ncbi:DUF3772 domain-containing protein [Thalassobius sp. I31.1]|uniref:DUF3772 domain-containing protein n=1 Tax=Thalassobius sp. I31.1 TaxID=2109912 RepID=UPI000D1AF94A|nr:DUF3772 domain-containing protein [Thalassobius sp. I31.1]
MGIIIRFFQVVFLLASLGLSSAALAQNSDQTGLDYTLWEATATRADDAIAAGRASDVALENLRSQLVAWRDGFTAAQDQNAPQIDSLRAQIAALGPVPEDGLEAEEIAARRQQLNDRLAATRAPVQTAEAARSRADALIDQIDSIILTRSTDELLSLGPTPVNPALWGGALNDLIESGTSVVHEFTNAWESPVQQAETKASFLPVSVLTVLGLVLLLRGRRWSERLALWLQSHNQIAWRWLLGFVVSLGQVALPVFGLSALVVAIYLTGLVGLAGDTILQVIPGAGMIFFAASWVGVRVFPRKAGDLNYLNLSAQQRTEGRLYAASLGLLIALTTVLVALADFENWPSETRVVLIFPMLLLVALMVSRIGQLLVAHYKNEMKDLDEGIPNYRCRMLRLMGRAAMFVAIGGGILAAIGYFQAGSQLVFPAAGTLGLLGFVLILQRLISEIWVLLSGRGEEARDTLVPVLAGFLLTLGAMPLLALIWGMRPATLSEYWATFLQGVPLGETRISPTVFISLAVIFSIGYMLTKLMQGALRNTILPKTNLDAGGQNAIVSGTGYIGIFLAALIAITGAGIDLSALAIVAGALSVGIGFGLQNIVSNFVSGIILLIERPIAEGDWIEVSGQSGTVKSISVRSTRIQTFDRADVIVPNADLISGVVMNMTKGNLTGRIIVPVGVAYGSDTRKIEGILREIAEAHPLVVMNPPPGVIFKGFGADSMDFEIRAILRDINFGLGVRSEMNHQIAERFALEGIEIPFAQRDIWLRNPEALNGSAGQGEQQTPPVVTTADDIDRDLIDTADEADSGGDAR